MFEEGLSDVNFDGDAFLTEILVFLRIHCDTLLE
jgi:hypothetical protein